ncbi:MAG: hypothetical protein M3Q30_01675 [Actinomycetota bacterium]|nr:hypothetical protein [Actinomycetota bacterium]
MASHTGASKRAPGAGATSSVEAAVLPGLARKQDAAARAEARRRAAALDASRTGVPPLGRTTIAGLVALYGEDTVAHAANVRVKELRRWTSGETMAPAKRRARLPVLRAAQKQLGQRAPAWLTRAGALPTPIELLRAGEVEDAWRKLRAAVRRVAPGCSR